MCTNQYKVFWRKRFCFLPWGCKCTLCTPSSVTPVIETDIQFLFIILYIYRIVASTNTCYYSENQIFDFLKSWILTCRIFFFGTKLFCLLSESAEILWGSMKSQFMNPHKISAHSDNFYFLTPHVTNRDMLLLATIRY